MTNLLDRITWSAIIIALWVIVTFTFIPWVSGVALGIVHIITMNMIARAMLRVSANEPPKEVIMIPHPMLVECFSNAAIKQQEYLSKQKEVPTKGETNGNDAGTSTGISNS